MFAICIESSHARGMGHLYRALNLADRLSELGQQCIFYLNDHKPSRQIIVERGFAHKVVNLSDTREDWESCLIEKDKISIWINDRLDTDIHHAENVKKNRVKLVTFDDRGKGATKADINFVALSFDASEPLYGDMVFRGVNYLILNPKIKYYTRVRDNLSSILVTLGGSDTHGVTIRVVELLKGKNLAVTVVIGPGFSHLEELKKILPINFSLKSSIPSMIEEFMKHDLAITGGGITPFEANASGLPCIVTANEFFEIPVGLELQRLGGCIYIGHHSSASIPSNFDTLKLHEMSMQGMESISLNGLDNVVRVLVELLK